MFLFATACLRQASKLKLNSTKWLATLSHIVQSNHNNGTSSSRRVSHFSTTRFTFTTMATTTTHHGGTIPITASPGLLFLRVFLPLLDSLDPAGLAALPAQFAPGSTFQINTNPPVPAEQVLASLAMRADKLSRFGHTLEAAWDVEHGDDGEVARTVLYQSVSTTVFKADEEAVEVRVKELSVLELVVVEGELKMRSQRTVLDMGAVIERARRFMGGPKE